MTIYLLAQIKIHDMAGYDLYQSQFMDVFSKFDGKVLAADFNPEILEGDWKMDRVILISFPDRDSIFAWINSDEYQAILKHRIASAKGIFLLAKGFEAA